MTRPIWVYADGELDGPSNMARDEHLLYSQAARPAALRLYHWSPPTLSLGYFQRFEEVARLPEDARRLAVVRRTTGGGAIVHDRELTYCLVLDDSVPVARQSPAELYRLVHLVWLEVLTESGVIGHLAPEEFPFPSPRSGPFFCFEKPGRTDLLLDGGKLLGSAQRRVPGHVLQHGSLILGRRFASHPGAHLDDPPADRVDAWSERFVSILSERLGLAPRAARWTSEQLGDVARRRDVYASEDWTRRR